MKTRPFTVLLLVLALATACSPQPTAAPQASAETPTASETPVPPTETATATLTFTPTLNPPIVSPQSEAVNCRYGPGAQYASVGGLEVGSSAPILGMSDDGNFWQIDNPKSSGETCWVAASVTVASGDRSSVPVIGAPASLVTGVSLGDQDPIEESSCANAIPPMDLTGSIEVNGPLAVTWHFETEQGGALPEHRNNFIGSGAYEAVDTSYTPPLDPGTYWVKLVVTDPINWAATAHYTITCP